MAILSKKEIKGSVLNQETIFESKYAEKKNFLTYNFDRVYSENDESMAFWNDIKKPIVNQAFNKKNVCIMSYGSSNTDKKR